MTRTHDRARSVYQPPWRVDIVERPGTPHVLPDAVIARAVAAALETAGAPQPGSVTVVLTDDGELGDLNAEHMGVDGPTDVLSFPMLSPEAFSITNGGPMRGMGRDGAPGQAVRDERVLGDRPPGARGPEESGRSRTHIGDIAISVERAIEQAGEGRGGQTGDVRWSAADELRLLVTHGTLHLCGWDHAEPAEQAAMRSLERELLAAPRA